MNLTIEQKQQEFNCAMGRYDRVALYHRLEILISIMVISLQLVLIILTLKSDLTIVINLISFFTAFVLADFLNGLVHLHMDNNDSYRGFWGPFVAKFHLHHKRPRYNPKSIFRVYFSESGSKIWMVPFIGVSLLYIMAISGSALFLCTLMYFSILSSVAELSHYLCHNSNSKLFLFLSRARILLDKKHHANHHGKDNGYYCFLNGMCDPLVDLIAKRFYQGYKMKSDLHYKTYEMIS